MQLDFSYLIESLVAMAVFFVSMLLVHAIFTAVEPFFQRRKLAKLKAAHKKAVSKYGYDSWPAFQTHRAWKNAQKALK